MRICRPTRRHPVSIYIVLFAVVSLFSFPAISRAQNSGSTIVFYADKQVSDTLWAPLFSAVKEDLADEDFGMANHAIDHSPRLLRNSELVSGEEFTDVIQVKLLGRCDVVQQAYRPLKPGPLGWVLSVQGQIQPYIYIDCTRMAQVLNPTTLGLSSDARIRAMSQAISHVLVHEWIHIATQNGGHTAHGISEAQLTAARLVTEPSHTPETNPDRPSLLIDRSAGDEK